MPLWDEGIPSQPCSEPKLEHLLSALQMGLEGVTCLECVARRLADAGQVKTDKDAEWTKYRLIQKYLVKASNPARIIKIKTDLGELC